MLILEPATPPAGNWNVTLSTAVKSPNVLVRWSAVIECMDSWSHDQGCCESAKSFGPAERGVTSGRVTGRC